ncbi:MAG: DUF523 domain-containing protein [candidate division NC10 bacterium]|nr:DUF523 domain-containing protein [candidate division NC10 bacterium]
MIIISACLAGLGCRHDGGSELQEPLAVLMAEGKAIPLCPEQLGGLPTPRPPAQIVGGDGCDVLAGRAWVRTGDGQDVTGAFIKGAREVLKVALLVRAERAILKDKSPSCGLHWIHQGEGLVLGMGVTAALLAQNGIPVEATE